MLEQRAKTYISVHNTQFLPARETAMMVQRPHITFSGQLLLVGSNGAGLKKTTLSEQKFRHILHQPPPYLPERRQISRALLRRYQSLGFRVSAYTGSNSLSLDKLRRTSHTEFDKC